MISEGLRFGEDLQVCSDVFASQSTSYDLASLFRSDRWEKSQNTLVPGCQLCTQIGFFAGGRLE